MKGFLIIILSSCFFNLNAQQNYNFNQIDSLQLIKRKNVIVYVYANWCKYCKAMEDAVSKDESLIKLMSERFYFVKLNAEDKQTIIYNGSKFTYQPSLGYHQMAISLSKNRKLSFPSIYVLSYTNEILYQKEGFINSKYLFKDLILIKPED